MGCIVFAVQRYDIFLELKVSPIKEYVLFPNFGIY